MIRALHFIDTLWSRNLPKICVCYGQNCTYICHTVGYVSLMKSWDLGYIFLEHFFQCTSRYIWHTFHFIPVKLNIVVTTQEELFWTSCLATFLPPCLSADLIYIHCDQHCYLGFSRSTPRTPEWPDSSQVSIPNTTSVCGMKDVLFWLESLEQPYLAWVGTGTLPVDTDYKAVWMYSERKWWV